jgi:hypothetical protein
LPAADAVAAAVVSSGASVGGSQSPIRPQSALPGAGEGAPRGSCCCCCGSVVPPPERVSGRRGRPSESLRMFPGTADDRPRAGRGGVSVPLLELAAGPLP